jgi:hypothetical protein
MSQVVTNDPNEPGPSTAAVGMPQERRVLLDALRERDGRLGTIYQAVVFLTTAEDLPDQLSLAAHAIREFMERLPVALDLPVEDKGSLLNHVDDLAVSLGRAEETSACRTTDGWSGAIDKPLERVLDAAKKVVESRKEHWPSRQEVAVSLMNELEPTLGRRSPSLVKQEAQTWSKLRRYFEQVSHHHHVFDALQTSQEELRALVQTIEALLIDKLRPTTTQDFDDIDSLMNAVREDLADG